jgi:hypothetical protein
VQASALKAGLAILEGDREEDDLVTITNARLVLLMSSEDEVTR